MTNNHTEDFYIEVLRARSLASTLTIDDLIGKINDGTFEYAAFGISKEVAIMTAQRAFKANFVSPLGGGPLGYQSIGSFTSTSLQPGVLDTPTTVTFGAGGNTTDDLISVGADGNISILKDGYYAFKQRFRAGRSGASGTSRLFFWAEISVDGGSTWNILGNSVDLVLDTSNDTTLFFDIANLYAPAGVLLRNRFARSSTGDNSGDLRTEAPSAALQALNVPSAPSSQITIYSLK